jgi:NAD(P) transhydrogenase subunit alpha
LGSPTTGTAIFMRIGIPAQMGPGETRVAATPEIVGKLAANHLIIVQSGTGLMA